MKKMVFAGLILLFFNMVSAQEIETIKIGDQVWMAENLKTTTFRNGDPIPEAKTEEEWAQAAENGTPMCIVFEFHSEIEEFTGKLYNFFAITDPRGLAPAGFHVPTDAEWTQLAESLGGAEEANDKLKSVYGWEEGSEGTDESEFNGLPGGKIDKDGIFDEFGDFGYWWSSSEAEGFGLNRNLSIYDSPFEAATSFKGAGFSVRCVKD